MRPFANLRVCAALIVFLSACMPGSAPGAQEASKQDQRAVARAPDPFCQIDGEFEQRLATRLGWILLSRDTVREKATIGCLIRLYSVESGPANTIISRAMVALLELDPTTFINVISRHPEVMRDWLVQLDSRVFWWDGDPPSPLEDFRQRLILRIEATSVPAESVATKTAIVSRLRAIRPTQVD